MSKYAFIFLAAFSFTACQSFQPLYGDSAIRRVDNCVCYKSIEGQQLKPWELVWDEPEKLRDQFSHCNCEAQIDLKKVRNPRRYVVPGTVVK